MMGGALVMCGCTDAGHWVIERLLEAGVRFAAFVCLTPEQGEHYQVAGYKDFADLANQYNVPLYRPQTYALSAPEDLVFFETHQFDLLVQGGWQRLFPESVLNTLRVGAIGGHGSSDYLPKGRGRSPLNWSLIEDKKRFIFQLFLIQPGVDDGPIFDTETIDILPWDSIQTLYYKLSILSAQMHLRSIPKLLAGSATFTPQVGTASYYPKRTPEDGWIDWEAMDVWQIHNLVRAVTKPYPGARAKIGGNDYLIWQAQVFDTRMHSPNAKYGEMIARFADGVVIYCRGGLLLITDYEVGTAV